MSCWDEGLCYRGKERDAPEHDFRHFASYWKSIIIKLLTFFLDSRALASDQAEYLITLAQVPQPCWGNSLDITSNHAARRIEHGCTRLGEFSWQVLRNRRMGEGSEKSTDSTKYFAVQRYLSRGGLNS